MNRIVKCSVKPTTGRKGISSMEINEKDLEDAYFFTVIKIAEILKDEEDVEKVLLKTEFQLKLLAKVLEMNGISKDDCKYLYYRDEKLTEKEVKEYLLRHPPTIRIKK